MSETVSVLLSLITVIVVAAVVFGSFYLYSKPTQTQVADTKAGLSIKQPVNPMPSSPQTGTQNEETQAPIR
jgi:flagellar basal body-associated protein FliL